MISIILRVIERPCAETRSVEAWSAYPRRRLQRPSRAGHGLPQHVVSLSSLPPPPLLLPLPLPLPPTTDDDMATKGVAPTDGYEMLHWNMKLGSLTLKTGPCGYNCAGWGVCSCSAVRVHLCQRT